MPQHVPEKSEIFLDYPSLASTDIYSLKTCFSQKIEKNCCSKILEKVSADFNMNLFTFH